jgi:hypothetical protein
MNHLPTFLLSLGIEGKDSLSRKKVNGERRDTEILWLGLGRYFNVCLEGLRKTLKM